VLADVSLTLEQGGFYVVTGPAGAGKTTLLRIIALGDVASEGRLTLFSSEVTGLDRVARARLRRRIGIVFQDLRLIDRLTARDNVALPLHIAGTAARQIDTDVSELLAWLGLADCGARPIAALSSRERRLVALARAIVGRPEVLLADEPAGSADPATLALLQHLFAQVNRLGTTVLIATQNGAFDDIAHRRYILDAGRLTNVAPVTS
jgi:cell division transport system ATP-binding protein